MEYQLICPPGSIVLGIAGTNNDWVTSLSVHCSSGYIGTVGGANYGDSNWETVVTADGELLNRISTWADSVSINRLQVNSYEAVGGWENQEDTFTELSCPEGTVLAGIYGSSGATSKWKSYINSLNLVCRKGEYALQLLQPSLL
jgi:hypothetical protein